MSQHNVAVRARPSFDQFRTVRAFDPALGQLPESLTMDRAGNVFLSMSDFIGKLAPDGSFARYATLPLPRGALALGVKVGPDGALYCATGGFAGDPAAAGVFRIEGPDRVARFAALDPHGFPNDLAFDGGGCMFVTEPFLGRIYRIDPRGQASVWLEHDCLRGDPSAPVLAVHAFGVDGIAFDAGHRNLYVGNLDTGSIVRIPVGRGGAAGKPEVVVRNALLKGADGIAFDRDGTLWVAVNGADRVVAVGPRGHLRVVAEYGALDAPSSLVFGTRPSDAHTLYLACFAINRALGAHEGAPRPALLALDVEAPGLPL